MDRVLEVGGIAAAYAGRLAVHAGHDVVRVTSVDAEPAWAGPLAMQAFLHADKRRVACRDNALLAELADAADVVFCEAVSADALAAMGFDAWAAPVKVALTPFGRSGPRRNWRATPSTLLAMGGYTALMGDADAAPLSLPGHYLEFQTGTLAYAAANAARLNEHRRVIDVGMLETVMALSQFTTVRWHCAGELRTRHGSDFWFVTPSELFRCADGWVYVNIVPSFWDAFCVFLDTPELLVDERYLTNDSRAEHREALHASIAAAIAAMTLEDVNRRAAECRVPVGVVLSFADVLAHEHLQSRDFWHPVQTPAGEVRVPGLPYRIDDARRQAQRLNEVEQSVG